MSLPVVLRHKATEELLVACDYLEAQRKSLSIRLIGEVRRVIDRISTHPELHGLVLKDNSPGCCQAVSVQHFLSGDVHENRRARSVSRLT
jgi:hypothetical protein